MKQPWYRDKAKLQAALNEHGSFAALSRARKIPSTTLKSAAGELGVKSPSQRIAPTKIGSEVSREELLEAEVKDLRAVAGAIRKEEVANRQLLDLLASTIDAKAPKYQAAPRERSRTHTTHNFFLEWSDLHGSERVSAEEMNDVNSYDWDIMLRRHEAMRQAVLSFREHRPYPVDTLYIGALGDMVTGDIHDELRETNEKVLAEATVQLGLDMADWLEGFVPEFQRIVLKGVVGNHGRRSQKPKAKQPFDNFDWIFYQILKQRLAKYESVTIEVPKSAMTIMQIFEKRILLWHGDGVRSTMPGVPWGGYMRRIKELDATYATMGTPIDHYALGHMHEPNVIAGGKILMNGSVKGPDEYSLRAFGGGAPATQLLHTFHPRRGLTDTSYINLQGVI